MFQDQGLGLASALKKKYDSKKSHFVFRKKLLEFGFHRTEKLMMLIKNVNLISL
jgi:hypothetical protein